MKIKADVRYIAAFIIIFAIEAAIAVFVHDNLIRPYVGDILVVMLIYCFLKAFVPYKGKLLPLYIFIFAVVVEAGQYFDLADLLGLSNNRIARIIIGSTFDIKDIACYLVGCLCIFSFETVSRHSAMTRKR